MINKLLNLKTLNKKSAWLSFQKLYILFWVASFIGHYLEVIWARSIHILLGLSAWHPSAPTIMPLAPPYGFGAVAVVLFIWPLMKKYKLNIVGSFVLSSLVTGLVEYLCGLILILVEGRNVYWDYADRFLNINGQVCLQSSLTFGVVALGFLYSIYPHYENFFHQLSRKRLDQIFWVFFVSYMIDLLFVNVK